MYPLVVGSFAAAGLLWSIAIAIRGMPAAVRRDARVDAILISGVTLLIGMLCGARLAYSLTNWIYFSSDPWKIFDIRAGGLSWMGLALGGLIALLIYAGLTDSSMIDLLGMHFPLIAVTCIGLWLGAQLAGVGYGPIVPSAWWALPVLDAAGDLSPRIPYPVLGSVLSLLAMMIIDLMGRRTFIPPVRTLVFCIFQFSTLCVLTFFRADPMVMAGGKNIERWGALIHLGLFSIALLIILLLAYRKEARTIPE
jgi:prolipoprotein diacylglyceryltransferase